jgi:hypothetical protein
MMFLDCPAHLDDDGAAQCGLPAEVRCSYTMQSTEGPLDSVMIRCPSGHYFNGPVEFLTPEHQDPLVGQCQRHRASQLRSGVLGGTTLLRGLSTSN